MKLRIHVALSLLASLSFVVLLIQPMKGDFYDCGTIFASADTWWYDVSRNTEDEFSGLAADLCLIWFFFSQMDGQECLRTSPSYLCFLVSNSIHAYITKFEQVIFGPSG